MEITAKQGSVTEQPCDVLIVNLFEGATEPGGGTGAVDKALGGAITEVIRDEDFKGKLGDVAVVRTCGALPAKRVVLVGLGKREDLGVMPVMRASAVAIRQCQGLQAKRVVSILHGAGIGDLGAYECARAVALGTILGAYQFTRHKTQDSKPNPVELFQIVELSAEKLDDIEQGIRRAEALGDAIILARDLGNEPSNVVTPAYLADLAQGIARECGMQCRVLDRKGIEDAGMGLLAAVSRGASVEPRFIEVRYEAPGAKRTVAIVGKGITFDSGGYSLKSSGSMYGMKDDMSGAGAVLAAIRAVGRLKPKVNVIALVPATENMIGDKAIHPGDVFKSYSGKTVEVNNTDAEGRLILSDAVAYAVKQNVDEIIDLATLTGGCVTALGRSLSGIFGTDQAIVDRLMAAGASCGELMWQLPLFEDYKSELDSDVADIKNTGGHEAAATNGALFIGSFVEDVPWAHIDLSSEMAHKETHLCRKGCTGIGTGTLVEYLTGGGADA